MNRRGISAWAGAAFVAAAVACGGGSTPKAELAPPSPDTVEQEEIRIETPAASPTVAAGPLPEPAPDQAISAPAAHQPPPQSGLAVLGELATAQALIVSLIVAPFASGTVDPDSPRDTSVPR